MTICAVIPAAGLGSRLGLSIPKILLPITKNQTVLSILFAKLSMKVDHIHIIASPTGAPLIASHLEAALAKNFVSISIQVQPIGMGNAIFQSYPAWENFEKILIIWGDQIFVSEKTLNKIISLHQKNRHTIGLPLTKMTDPYVEYVFNNQNQLLKINLSREGDVCSPGGLADIGTFLLSVPGLLQKWQSYLEKCLTGRLTGEINFLPFIIFLQREGWQLQITDVQDPTEARGINTLDDLDFFKNLYKGRL